MHPGASFFRPCPQQPESVTTCPEQQRPGTHSWQSDVTSYCWAAAPPAAAASVLHHYTTPQPPQQQQQQQRLSSHQRDCRVLRGSVYSNKPSHRKTSDLQTKWWDATGLTCSVDCVSINYLQQVKSGSHSTELSSCRLIVMIVSLQQAATESDRCVCEMDADA